MRLPGMAADLLAVAWLARAFGHSKHHVLLSTVTGSHVTVSSRYASLAETLTRGSQNAGVLQFREGA